jgi:hypothetical protein
LIDVAVRDRQEIRGGGVAASGRVPSRNAISAASGSDAAISSAAAGAGWWEGSAVQAIAQSIIA